MLEDAFPIEMLPFWEDFLNFQGGGGRFSGLNFGCSHFQLPFPLLKPPMDQLKRAGFGRQKGKRHCGAGDMSAMRWSQVGFVSKTWHVTKVINICDK